MIVILVKEVFHGISMHLKLHIAFVQEREKNIRRKLNSLIDMYII